jgi:hypothetical protein
LATERRNQSKLSAILLELNRYEEARQEIRKVIESEDYFSALLAKLQSILCGDRDLALAADTELYYQDAAELRLLLDHFSPPKVVNASKDYRWNLRMQRGLWILSTRLSP